MKFSFISTYLTENLTLQNGVFGQWKMVTLERTDHVYDPALAGWYLVKNKSEERNMLNIYELNFYRPKPGAALGSNQVRESHYASRFLIILKELYYR